ncbi:MAG: rRNA pseudouridine synthase [Opitutales bacterium]|nr:rRNA pseudouridine synthase [Opitutales bacterium]
MKPRRLDELLASCGYTSRREVKNWIRAGRVRVRGQKPASASIKADPGEVLIDGEPVDHPGVLLVLMHKPAGYVCSHDDREGPRVYDLLPPRWQARNPSLNTVGRLDKDTTGALLLTDDGTLVHAWTHPKRKVEKHYLVDLAHPLDPTLIGFFAAGDLVLEGETTPCRPARLEILGDTRARLVLTEGKYHQVRRMFAAVGNEVLRLHRECFGPCSIAHLLPGQFETINPTGPREEPPGNGAATA